MMQARQRTIFDIATDQLREFHFSQALKLASEGAKNYKLYADYRQDFANVRLLAFQNHDFGLASEKLAILLRKLNGEINGGQTQCH